MRFICTFYLSLTVISCSKEPIPYSELVKQVPRLTILQSPYNLECSYRPPWILAKRDFDASTSIDELTKILSSYEGNFTFVLKIGADPNLDASQRKLTDIVNAQPSIGHFTQNLHHLFYGMDDKIYILTGDGIKVPVGSYYLDRNWGITHVNYLMLTFPAFFQDRRIEDEGDLELVIQNLNQYLPELRFYFKENPIKKMRASPEYIHECLLLDTSL